ncbi:HTH-type transcriptional regulator KipR [Pigmentiphaga humi]|uniref:HTH-type transcriptional regulator KipR n=2 Tax=Pigmentiphaga humi TaxID=2478468 RepID=A0A3P4B5W2_9BURK|nr:HTH-type transcriptional regulator KipR [Pigmentiphaga humi]
MLDVLDLFRPDQSVVDVEVICRQLGYAPATAYRYIRELCAVGLLVRLPGGYALGPRVIQLDLQMREYDPMLADSRELMEELGEETGLNVLLSELYGNSVITVHHHPGRDPEPLRFGRGRPMALLRSATARVVLAHLPPRQLRRLYDEHAQEADMQRLGKTWKDFSRAMLEIRRSGYCLSKGDLDPDKAGLAAPIFDERKRILGSITAVGSLERVQAFNEDYLANRLRDVAGEITQRISQRASA